MSIVVSDTSPIRALAHLGLLSVLGKLYDDVVIPPAVFAELTREGRVFSALSSTEIALFRLQEPVIEVAQTAEFLALDAGEREAIRLALELSAAGLLIDENSGRRVATKYGLRVTGTLGILGQAKQCGLISSVGPMIDRLQNEINFFIAPALRREVLKDLGEWPSSA